MEQAWGASQKEKPAFAYMLAMRRKTHMCLPMVLSVASIQVAVFSSPRLYVEERRARGLVQKEETKRKSKPAMTLMRRKSKKDTVTPIIINELVDCCLARNTGMRVRGWGL